MNKLVKWQGLFCIKSTPITKVLQYKGVKISIKRDDLNHEIVQGNKLRKLKYNLKYALENNYSTLATFGGAWSNHIVALAQAAKLCDLTSVGFIRGEELKDNPKKWSASLNAASENGMHFVFLNRQEYREKQYSNTVKLFIENQNNKVYLVPEGGTNNLALQGVAEIIFELQQQTNIPTHIITACGTGGTLAGLVNGIEQSDWHTLVIGIPVLRGGDFLQKDIEKLLKKSPNFNNKTQWQMFFDYHAGGYAKTNQTVINFGHRFVQDTGIDLDKIYTSKSFYAAYNLIDNGYIKPESHIVILHTGGLQGGLITDCQRNPDQNN